MGNHRNHTSANNRSIAIGGNVTGSVLITGDDNVVDQRTTATAEDFHQALAKLRAELDKVKDRLPPEAAENAEADLQQIEKAAGREKPDIGRIKTFTETLASTLEGAGKIGKTLEPLVKTIGTLTAGLMLGA